MKIDAQKLDIALDMSDWSLSLEGDTIPIGDKHAAQKVFDIIISLKYRVVDLENEMKRIDSAVLALDASISRLVGR